MGAGQDGGLAGDGPHLGDTAAIHASPLLDDQAAHLLLLQILENLLHLQLGLGRLRDDKRQGLVQQDASPRLLLFLLGHEREIPDAGTTQPFHPPLEPRVHRSRHEGRLGHPHLPGQVVLQPDDGLHDPVAVEQPLQERLFRHLVCPALHHDHGGLAAGDDHIHVALGQLGIGRVHDEPTTHAPDPDAADGTLKRNLGHGESRRGSHHRQDIRIVLLIGGEDRRDDLDVLMVPLRKQRTDRPVDQPRGQRLLLVWAPLALEETAGDLAGGVGPLLIVDRQGEEIDPLAGLLGGHGRHQDHRVPIANPGRAVRGARHTPRLDREGSTLQIDLAPIRHFRIPSLSITCLYRATSLLFR